MEPSAMIARPPAAGKVRAIIAILAMLAATLVSIFVGVSPAAAATGAIPAPFTTGQTWNICQGYDYGTHTGTSEYGLDLTGAGCDNSAAGRSVIAPISGTLAYPYQASVGNLCINIAGGRSYTLTHIVSTVTGSVTAGQVVGTVGPAQGNSSLPVYNYGLAHLHFQIWSSTGCYNSNVIPFDAAHSARICGAPDLTASGTAGSQGTWSGTNFTGAACGTSSPNVGDYDNSGTTDVSVFRPSDGGWHIRNVGDFTYGQSGDIPVPGDYDGNGTIEGAVYRPGNPAYWYIRGGTSVAFGNPGDVPVPAKWNGDATLDPAVFRPSDGSWHIRNIDNFTYGQSGDIPVPGDYDGNGTIEAAVFRPSTGYWYVRGGTAVQYGQAGDIPMPGDWNGDATLDIAVFRPSTGDWHIRGIGDFTYGQSGDVPLVGDFDGNGAKEAAVYRPSNNYWYVRGGTAVQYGQSGDIPAPYVLNSALLVQLGLL